MASFLHTIALQEQHRGSCKKISQESFGGFYMVLSLFALPSAAVAAHSDSMAVISHNIANVNTPGSKGSISQFRPLLAEAQSVETKLRGRHGLQTYERSDLSRQGTPIVTGRRLDLAIQGEGFFTLQNAAGDVTYTRNGSFEPLFDDAAPVGANNFLGDAFGNYVLGWSVNDAFAFPTKSDATLDRILLSETLSVQGSPSNEGLVDVVLDVNDGFQQVRDLEHKLAVIDGGGEENTVLFRYSALEGEANAWLLRATRSEGNVVLNEAILRFDDEGRLASLEGVGDTLVEDEVLVLQGEGLGGGINVRVDLAAVRSYGGGGQVVSASVDGVVGGLLDEWSISEHGLIEGSFSNGDRRAIAQIAIADLVNPDSFNAEDGTRFRPTEGSGDVTYYDLLETRRARVFSGQLESSTVTLGEEFARMIETQSAYNLASLTLQTVNDLTRTAVDVKR